MLERYIEKNGKKMRYGYTTGSCSAAAAKAATLLLFGEGDMDSVSIDTPKGWTIDIPVETIIHDKASISVTVIKDGGDDPDVTNGLEVVAHVTKSKMPGVRVDGGIGVGRVTKKRSKSPSWISGYQSCSYEDD